jgi:putative CocE/NonD family hydrolase
VNANNNKLERGIRTLLRFVAPAFMVLLTIAPAHSRDPVSELPASATIGDYQGQDVMIPMRDGKRLHAEIWRPKNSVVPLPFLIQRSPYGFGFEKVGKAFDTQFKELGAEGFIFVLEDIRGRFGSEGEFVMLRPPAGEKGGVDESTDTYDTIAWLLQAIPANNGKVGVFGISYLGWTTAMATINPHPALKAISVQASPEDMYLGDDFHHNGAFRLSYAWEYTAALETDSRTTNAFDFDHGDPYQWYLNQFHLADLDQRSLGRKLPTWQNFVRHPNYDRFWRSAVTSSLMPKDVTIPNLIVAGWWDQEDFYGPLTIYREQRKGDAGKRIRLVIGPWNHGGWGRGESDHYGPYDLGSDTGRYFRATLETPWFRYWLKDKGALDESEAIVFETGSNHWQRYGAWPPISGVRRKHLYFHPDGMLSFMPPRRSETATKASFLSDPSSPVPYRPVALPPTMAEESSWRSWLADDQASFSARPDVLTWKTEPLKDDVTIRGDVIARLFASTTGSDVDWIVKLIDVYPTDNATPAALRGRQLLIADEVFRGRFRSSFEHPSAIKPNEVLEYSIDMHSASHLFKPGHQIAVQVQSTWFPLIDRNPQTFQANIFEAAKQSYQTQTHTVYYTPLYPSAIAVDVPKDQTETTALDKRLPSTKAGRLLQDWMKLCQSPNLEQMTKWAAAHISEALAKHEPTADQARRYADFCADNGRLNIVEVTQPGANAVSLVMVSLKSGTWFKMTLSADESGKWDQARIVPTTPSESTIPKDLSDAAIVREVRRTVAKLARLGLFSGIVTVARGTTTIVSAGGGYADRTRKIPVTGSTQFTLGSMGKLFTVVAVGQLVDQGKISFDDPVGKFFPDYPNQTVRDRATVGMLLAHTAGMGDFLERRTSGMMQSGVHNAAEFMPLYDHDEPKFAPGTSWAYSNAGEALAGAIVEKVSGEAYPDYLRRHIFAVAGMTHSDPNNTRLASAKLATPYTKTTSQGQSSNWQVAEQDIGSPAGGAISTADDLVRFADALRNGKLVSPATFAQIIKPHDGGAVGGTYGYAISINSVYGRTVVGHNGGFPGVSTHLHLLLDSPYTVVVLANQDPPTETYPSSSIVALVAEKANLGK